MVTVRFAWVFVLGSVVCDNTILASSPTLAPTPLLTEFTPPWMRASSPSASAASESQEPYRAVRASKQHQTKNRQQRHTKINSNAGSVMRRTFTVGNTEPEESVFRKRQAALAAIRTELMWVEENQTHLTPTELRSRLKKLHNRQAQFAAMKPMKTVR